MLVLVVENEFYFVCVSLSPVSCFLTCERLCVIIRIMNHSLSLALMLSPSRTSHSSDSAISIKERKSVIIIIM